MRTLVPPLGPQHWVPWPVPSLETHLRSEEVMGRPNGFRYICRKEETRFKSNGCWRRGNGKHREGRRRERRLTPTRAVAQDTRASQLSRNSSSEEVRGHWTLRTRRINGWMYFAHYCPYPPPSLSPSLAISLSLYLPCSFLFKQQFF